MLAILSLYIVCGSLNQELDIDYPWRKYVPECVLYNGLESYSLEVLRSLWPSDPICSHKSWSTLALVKSCCPAAPRHYLNHCWFIISKVRLHSSGAIFKRNVSCQSLTLAWKLLIWNSILIHRGGPWVDIYKDDRAWPTAVIIGKIRTIDHQACLMNINSFDNITKGIVVPDVRYRIGAPSSDKYIKFEYFVIGK